MREYGVRPAPLSCSSIEAGGVSAFAEQKRAAVAELAGPDAELVAAVDGRQRSACRHGVAGQEGEAIGRRPGRVEAQQRGRGGLTPTQ